ncbi:MAG: sigma-70 family RNA polymerase sigma factor [Clostridia bacterium]|nr:sigma-70 family RNA polymerase sigma factor [Clostridia bacterium]
MQRLTSEQRRMVEDNLPLVTYTMNERIRYVSPDDWDDVFQEGAIGLCRAVKLYDPAYGVQFATFAVPCIINAVYAHMRKWTTGKHRAYENAVRLEERLSHDRDEDLLVGHTIAARETVESEFAYHSLMDFIKHALPDKESKIVFLLLDGKTQIEIADAVGLSQPQISRTIKKIENRIRLFRFGESVAAAA